MRLLVRLLGGMWVATLIVSIAFAYLEVKEERSRLILDLQRRSSLAADAVREASERLVARGARTGYERVLQRFGRGDRSLAIYDAFGSVIDATADVKPYLGPLSAFVTQPNEVLTKGALMDAAWEGAAIEEANLSVQVAVLRKHLGSSPSGTDWIATIPRVGYRFVGEVEPGEAAVPGRIATAASSDAGGSHQTGRVEDP